MECAVILVPYWYLSSKNLSNLTEYISGTISVHSVCVYPINSIHDHYPLENKGISYLTNIITKRGGRGVKSVFFIA